MKRYFAFYHANYYPLGGMKDFIGDFSSIQEALAYIEKYAIEEDNNDKKWDNASAHIWDSQSKMLVYERLDDAVVVDKTTIWI
jgi:hypothetical protein